VRVTILEVERDRLVDALRKGKTWGEAKALVPDVDPEVLDRGFQAWAHKEAGLELEDPAPELPEGVEGVTADALHAAVDEHLEAAGAVVLAKRPATVAAPSAPAPKKARAPRKPKTTPAE
jgi:hypothetical protein